MKLFQKKKDKDMLIKVGASFMAELQTNRNLRRSVTKNAPTLNNRLRSLGIALKK
jgi:hypothetical protein